MTAIANPRVNLTGALQLVHRLITSATCESVFKKVRTTERARKWTLEAMVSFWVAVVTRAPPSLRAALDECFGREGASALGFDSAPSSFFERSQNLRWQFFQEVFRRFIAALVPQCRADFDAELRAKLPSFPEIWIVDGSGLDRVRRRLKDLRGVEEVVIPGSVLACYDLFRGIVRVLEFHEKLLGGEASRLRALLDEIPRGTLLVADRGYSSARLLRAIAKKGLHALVRIKRNHVLETVEELGRYVDDGCAVVDRIVIMGTGGERSERVRVRVIEKSLPDGQTLRLATTVLDSAMLPALAALELYRRRWAVERMFHDLKEVLNLNRFYAANTNAVAMQVFATAIVHSALRATQAQIAQEHGRRPEELSAEKLFPRAAAAHFRLVEAIRIFEMIKAANPGVELVEPDWVEAAGCSVTLDRILVETRKGVRRKPKYSKARTRVVPLRTYEKRRVLKPPAKRRR